MENVKMNQWKILLDKPLYPYQRRRIMKRRILNEQGFTLVELLIVVIILGILAAVAIPQFGDSSEQAREETLSTNISTLRGAVELYKAEHGVYPGRNDTAGAATTGNMAAAAAGFTAQLTLYTDMAGNTSNVKDTVNFPFGPYLKKGAVPDNPYVDDTIICVEGGNLVLAAADAAGWRFDVESGRLIADNTGNDTSGLPYEDY